MRKGDEREMESMKKEENKKEDKRDKISIEVGMRKMQFSEN